jgi:hypothetical protein
VRADPHSRLLLRGIRHHERKWKLMEEMCRINMGERI